MSTLKRLTLLVIVVLLIMPNMARAQTAAPWQMADAARKALFNAQAALLESDKPKAQASRDEAQRYLDAFAALAEPLAPGATKQLRGVTLSLDNGTAAFAAQRATVWATVLHAGYDATLNAIAKNQPDAAQQWLQVRAFRKSTKLNSANADATQSLAAWRDGKLSQQDALANTKADLLDGYNAQLREALSAVDKSAKKQVAESAAENAALAQGYFNIFAADFAKQRGADAAKQLDAAFAQLVNASVAGDWATLDTRHSTLDTLLANFTPVPLTDKDVNTKGAQISQFVTLAHIEYAKGVRNGQVTVPLEYGEAKTFTEQAQALFNEIKPALTQRNADATAQVEAALAQMPPLIDKMADGTALNQPVDGIVTALRVKLGIDAQGGDLTAVQALLKQMQQSVVAGDYANAETLRLQAYAMFEVGAEQKLITRDGKLGSDLQAMFWQGTVEAQGLSVLIKNKTSASDVNATLTKMTADFAEADALLNTKMTPPGVIAASVAIMIREGLEAVLVLAAIIGYLRATKAPTRAQTQVLGGAGLAILLSLVVWALAQSVILITAVHRELFEGVIALVAAAVLFYVTNWLLHKVYVADWMTFVKQQVQKAMGSGAIFGLAALGFMIVFREGFETVLFFQALLFDAPAWAVLVGAIIGAAIIGGIAVAMLRFGLKLPLKPFFTVTGLLLLVLAVSFVGIGVRNLQEAGLVGVTRFDPIPSGMLPALLGLFPTVETVTAQALVLLALAVTFVIAKLTARPKVPATKVA